ncbi:MAG: hypothetical protein V2I63_10780 [Pseudomonadales bacterium]|jgi:hypothetical protein|nr:hypothetical protein [Pseudomonadales bacterium]
MVQALFLGVSAKDRAEAPELWFLRLHQASGLPPWAFGLLTAAVVFGAVSAPMAYASLSPLDELDLLASAAFFATSLGFLFGAAPIIFPAAVRDLERLEPILDEDPARFRILHRALLRMPTRVCVVQGLLGAALGSAHATLIFGPGALGVALPPALGTLCLWIMMFQIAAPMLGNARLFDELGRSVTPDLLLPHRLHAFGATALRPTLFMIGLQCTYPILALGPGDGLAAENYIGLAVAFSLVVGLFFVPLRGVRSQLRQSRDEALQTLDARIAALAEGRGMFDAQTSDEALARAEHLLTLRARIASVSSWPLGLAGLRRVALYVILPPLTWAAAALVERLVDRSL